MRTSSHISKKRCWKSYVFEILLRRRREEASCFAFVTVFPRVIFANSSGSLVIRCSWVSFSLKIAKRSGRASISRKNFERNRLFWKKRVTVSHFRLALCSSDSFYNDSWAARRHSRSHFGLFRRRFPKVGDPDPLFLRVSSEL